ncbi:MAG: tetratricopeptide repeat protein [Prevotellaceae bacterium]|jgi:tetratricopeptide (TPR) repeat protein|nr:tetratricopeptide repeat protein [Prevotellaceae bacterium]
MKKQPAHKKKALPVAEAAPVDREKTPLDKAWERLLSINFKRVFWLSLALCAALTFYWSSKAGQNGDGPLDYEYGAQCVDYYLSGGSDTACLHFTWEDIKNRVTQKYYGCGFEATFVLLQKWFKWNDYYQVRLYYLALWSVALLLFMALIAKELTGWKGAVLALWLTFLWPFVLGQFFWNTKDIPQALGFAIAIFFLLRFLRLLPHVSIKNLLGVALGIAIALSIRVSGVLLIFYVGLFSLLACFTLPAAKKLFAQKNYAQILKITALLLAAVVLGVMGGLIFYPNFFEEGFGHLLSGLHVATNFPQRIPFVFEGKMTDSIVKPWYYLLKMFYITTPMLILIMLHLAVLVALWRWRKTGALNLFMLLFMIVFPFAYIMWAGTPVYNGWRHVLFACVTIPATIAVGYKELLDILRRSALLKWLSAIAILASCAYLAVWNVRHAPCQLGYYNCSVGGTEGAYKKYEFDQWQIATSEGMEWLLNSINPDDYSQERPLVVAMNNWGVCKTYYVPEVWKGKLQLKDVAFRSYAGIECDYAILTTLFASPQILSFFYPPKGVVYKRTVDNVVAMCVVDRRNDTDYKGVKSLKDNDIGGGVKLLEEAYAYNPKNFSMYYWMGYGYYRAGNHEKAIKSLNAYKKFYPGDKETHRVLGYAYYSSKSYDKALEAFNIFYSQDRSDLSVAYVMALCLYEKKDYKGGIAFLKPVAEQNPSFADGQNLLRYLQTLAKD